MNHPSEDKRLLVSRTAIDTQERVEVAVHGAKAPYRYREDFVEIFESLVDPFFPLETVLIGKQRSLTAAARNTVRL